MNCPKCVGRLEKIVVGKAERTPFHVDRCFVCSGYWFDVGELKKALSLNAPIAKGNGGFASVECVDDLDQKSGPCPRCGMPMIKMPNGQEDLIQLDYCWSCSGFWTDGGEFERLMTGGNLKRLIIRLFDRIKARFRSKTGGDLSKDGE